MLLVSVLYSVREEKNVHALVKGETSGEKMEGGVASCGEGKFGVRGALKFSDERYQVSYL